MEGGLLSFNFESVGMQGWSRVVRTTIRRSVQYSLVRMKSYEIPAFTTIKELSKISKLSSEKVCKLLGVILHGKRYFANYPDYDVSNDTYSTWYEFVSVKDIIIPYIEAKKALSKVGITNTFLLDYSKLLESKESVYSINYNSDNTELIVDKHPCRLQLVSKVPVIVLLGHFNHGKTSLLDCLLQQQNTLLAAYNSSYTSAGRGYVSREAGKITQYIRTSAVLLKSSLNCVTPCTVLDTPGQSIFHGMRHVATHAGSGVDAVVLVVSLVDDIQINETLSSEARDRVGDDDGIEGLPQQTVESIVHLENLINDTPSSTPNIIICLTKVDLVPDDQQTHLISTITKMLRRFAVLENASICTISALTNRGIPELSDAILNFIGRNCMQRLPTVGISYSDMKSLRNMSEWAERSFVHRVCSTPRPVLAKGVILNCSRAFKAGGVLIHFVLSSGVVNVGDVYLSDSWTGRVKNIFIEDMNDTGDKMIFGALSVKTTSVDRCVAGFAAFLLVSLEKLDHYSRYQEVNMPSGEIIWFLRHTKDNVELCERSAAHSAMSNSFESHRLTHSDVTAYSIPTLERWSQADSQPSQSLRTSEECADESLDDEFDNKHSTQERKIIIRVDSDLTVRSIQDAIDDYEESLGSGELAGECEKPARILGVSVGDVSVRDVQRANSSRAVIYCFGVRYPSVSVLNAHHVQLIRFSTIEELINACCNKTKATI